MRPVVAEPMDICIKNCPLQKPHIETIDYKTPKALWLVGALICEVKGCTLPVRVGSGFSNEERIKMTRESPIGKRIEIEAFSYSKNRQGYVSLNLPIFKRFKEDK